jgi:nucleoside-diphosphate-sugar epimerase
VTTPQRVVVFGATGFVGAGVAGALQAAGAIVVPLTTPRIRCASPENAGATLQGLSEDITGLAHQLQGADCVVNAAGVAEAASLDEGLLTAANGIVPGYLAMAAAAADVPRFVHVSSAAVQGRFTSSTPPPRSPPSPHIRDPKHWAS